MNHAREAIGAVHMGAGWVWVGTSAGASAHKATRGENCEFAAHAGNAPMHFPSEPSGSVLEKFWAKNTALSFWFDNGRPPTLGEWLDAMSEAQDAEKLDAENSRGERC